MIYEKWQINESFSNLFAVHPYARVRIEIHHAVEFFPTLSSLPLYEGANRNRISEAEGV